MKYRYRLGLPVTVRVEKEGRDFRTLKTEIDEALLRATERGLEEMKRLAPRFMGRSPGNARRAIRTSITRTGPGEIRGELYTVEKIPYWLSRGTGIYGPHRTKITPRRAQALRFNIRGRTVYARSVKGIRGNRWLERTGEASEQAIQGYYREELSRVFGRQV